MAFEFKLPDVGEGTTEGEIVRWLVKVGDHVQLDQPLVEVETDKAVVELPAPVAGRVVRCIGQEGEVVPVGATLVVIDDGRTDSPGAPLAAPGGSSAPAPRLPSAGAAAPGVRAAPATRRLAKEAGIDLATVQGTGPQGRIVPADVREAGRSAPAVGSSPGGRRPFVMSSMRQRIAEHLTESVRTIPQVTVVDRFDATQLVQARAELNREATSERSPVKVTYLAIVAKAVCIMAQNFAELNARWEHDTLYLYDDVHLGIAVDTEMGLVVPVISHAGSRTIYDLAKEIAFVAEQARAKKLGPDRIAGSTITVTGGGPLGGLFATPIINAPEVAIVGMYPIVYEPRKMAQGFEERATMYLSLTFDHRVIDGVKASKSLALLKALLQEPYQLLGYMH